MTTIRSESPSRRVRKSLAHPVIDCDAHTIEVEPVLYEYIRELAGPVALKSIVDFHSFITRWYDKAPADRVAERITRPPWGMRSKNARDIATPMLPKLMYERLDEMGIDFCIQLPTLGLLLSRMPSEECRRKGARAVNTYTRDMYAGLGDRLISAAVIPMWNPNEALDELEHAVGTLGHKVIVIDSATWREASAAPGRMWLDSYGLDSLYDYDLFWKRCEELGVAVCGHTGGHYGSRQSISSYTANHLGLFAAGGEALCRSLFMGGVMTRHKKLQVGFLEGGVAWAGSLLADLIEHWEKRRGAVLDEYDRKHVDLAALREIARAYGGGKMADAQSITEMFPMISQAVGWHGDFMTDDFAALDVHTKKDLRERFTQRYYFGCEADDTMVAVAFDERLHNTTLRAFFGSDIGHWDVEHLDGVVAESHAYLVRRGLLTDEQFGKFMFEHGALFHAGSNPRFFEGTVIEKEVAAVLANAAARG